MDDLEAPQPAVPVVVRRIARTERVDLVWRNVLGGVTFRIGERTELDRFLKWAPVEAVGLDLMAEAERLAWAIEWVSVPRVLDTGADSDGAWMVTSPIRGRSAVDSRWQHRPESAVVAIGNGLRVLHNQLPVDRCPFTWSVGERLADAAEQSAIKQARPPEISRLVVCHDDACAPNTLLDDDGAYVSHVDFGCLGTADRWADLAVALWSIRYNWGSGWDETFLDAYEIAADPERTSYYQQLWHLS